MKNLASSFVKARNALRQASTKATTLKIRGYVEIRRIGKGAFGHAVLVSREASKEQFCAKMVKYKHMASAEKDYVLREVQTMTHLSNGGGHPYLVRFRESFVTASGSLCMIMDFCDGGDLAGVVKSASRKRTPFTEAQVHLWILQLLSATDYLHTLKVLHRDIKPANVFMHSGVCKLGDLGLSKQVMQAATQPGKHTQCGSPLYLTPEVHMGQKYGKSVDVWALGCVLFELMMLDHAFQGKDNNQILQNIVWARHAQISKAWGKALVTNLKWMLSLKPEDRPDAKDVINDPCFTEMIKSGTLNPKALRHLTDPQSTLAAHRIESPVDVMEMQVTA